MGSRPSKQGKIEESDMDGYPPTVTPADNGNQNNNGGEHKTPEASGQEHTTEMDDMSMARATVEEPKTTGKVTKGGQENLKSILIRDFDMKNMSKLERKLNKNHGSDIEMIKQVDCKSVVVEFKSRQVAEDVLKDPPYVEEKVLKLSLLDITTYTKDAKITKDQGTEVQAVPASSVGKGKGRLNPDLRHKTSQRPDVQEEENEKQSKPKQGHHERGWQHTGASSTMVEAVVHTDTGEDEAENKSNAQIPDATDKSVNVRGVDTTVQVASKTVSETYIELDAVKVEFIQKVHGNEFDDICSSNNVAIVTETGPLSSTCKVIFRENLPGKGDVEGACDQFLDMYRSISDKLSKNNILNVLTELPECTIQRLKDALSHAESNQRVLVKNCLGDDFKIVFYGSEPDVDVAIATFISRSRKQHTTRQDSDEIADSTQFEITFSDIKVSVYKGDITQQKADVVVNAANSELKHFGGVALAISKAGGKSIQEESRDYVMRHGALRIGQAMHTSAGNMPCQHVIHTVGPMWDSYKDKETVKAQLHEALTNVLEYASNELQAKSISIPAISAGIYGVPVDVCAEQLMQGTLNFVRSPPVHNTLRHIIFVNIEDNVNRAFVRVFRGGLSSHLAEVRSPDANRDNECPICLGQIVRPRRLYCCGNEFCADCIEQAFKSKPVCPSCRHQHGALKGTQPKGGRMTYRVIPESLPGYPERGCIEIDYYIPSGVQEDCHPNPRRPYEGTKRFAYLPNNREGKQVLQLLKMAFDNRLVFTVGTSATTGQGNVVTWNDIHHKTSITGSYGYPDPDYLRRVREELAAKGIR
ncbi:uncharacterized protein LOC144922590 [Branchiostoma floridae x Branchiostoma belcheri]